MVKGDMAGLEYFNVALRYAARPVTCIAARHVNLPG